jgi:hypothetical protein
VKKLIYEIARAAALLSPTLLLTQLISIFSDANWHIPVFILEVSLIIFPIATVALFLTMPTSTTFHRCMRRIIGLSFATTLIVNLWIVHMFLPILLPDPSYVGGGPGSGDEQVAAAIIFFIYDGIALFILLIEFIVLTGAELLLSGTPSVKAKNAK